MARTRVISTVTTVVLNAAATLALGTIVVVLAPAVEGTTRGSAVGDEGVTLVFAETLTEGHHLVILGRASHARRPAAAARFLLLPRTSRVDAVQDVRTSIQEVSEPTHCSLDSREGVYLGRPNLGEFLSSGGKNNTSMFICQCRDLMYSSVLY